MVHNPLSINMETPQSTSTLREATPLEAVSFLESELSTIPPSTEEQSTRSTSPQCDNLTADRLNDRVADEKCCIVTRILS